MDNRANQKNPNHQPSKGGAADISKNKNREMSKAEQDFRSQQKNPNNEQYYKSRTKQ